MELRGSGASRSPQLALARMATHSTHGHLSGTLGRGFADCVLSQRVTFGGHAKLGSGAVPPLGTPPAVPKAPFPLTVLGRVPPLVVTTLMDVNRFPWWV